MGADKDHSEEIWEQFAYQVRRRVDGQADALQHPRQPALLEAVVTADDFAQLFGAAVVDNVPHASKSIQAEHVVRLPQVCRDRIARNNFRYIPLSDRERDFVLLQTLKRVDAGRFSKAGMEGKARWEAGWGENYQNFVASNYDLSQLIPKYIHPDRPLRLWQNYILAQDANFELNWYEIYRHWLFSTYLNDYDHIYEFACGPCHNVVALAQMFPDKSLFALDWAQPSVEIAKLLHSIYGWNVTGLPFDFFHPDPQIKIQPNSAVITIGGLEQTGDQHAQFFDYLLEQRPALVIHVEPFLEWYDENNIVDYVAIRFHTVRNYLKGYIPRLMEAEKEGRIQVVKANRCFFGSLFHDGYSLMIWKPV